MVSGRMPPRWRLSALASATGTGAGCGGHRPVGDRQGGGRLQTSGSDDERIDGAERQTEFETAEPMVCTRNTLVEPGVPGGLPATMTTLSPFWYGRVQERGVDLADHVVGVVHRRHEEGLHTPGEGELAAGGGSVVNASSGIGER